MGPRSPSSRILVPLVLAFLVLRLLTLLTSVEDVSWDEELYRGTIAKELIEGLKVPFWEYRADHYDGGSLVVGMLAVPFFWLLGPNLFALKLVPLGFSLGTLILTFLFLKRFFNGKAALVACSLLVLSPPVSTALSLSAIGSHPESVFFGIAMLFGLYQFLYGKRYRTISLILFGLVAGLGCWFASLSIFALFTCLVSWLLWDRRSFFSNKLWISVFAFGVGLLPWLLYNATHDFLGFRALGAAFLGGEGSFFGRLFALVTNGFPFSFCFRDVLGIPGAFLSLAYSLATLWVIAPFFWREGKKLLKGVKSLPFLLYPLIFFLAYSASNRPLPVHSPDIFIEYRWFAPVYYFGSLLVGLAYTTRKGAVLGLGVLLCLGAIGQGSLLFQEPFGRALHYQGYSDFLLGKTWEERLYAHPNRFSEFQGLAGQFDASKRRYLYWGASLGLNWGALQKDPRVLAQWIRRINPEYRHYFLEGWGWSSSFPLSEELSRQLAEGRLFAQEEEPYVLYGLGNSLGLHLSTATSLQQMNHELDAVQGLFASHPDLWSRFLGWYLYEQLERLGWNPAALEMLDKLEKDKRTWALRGMGQEAGLYWTYSNVLFSKTFRALWDALSQEDRQALSWGIGWSVRDSIQMMEDRVRSWDRLQRLPPAMRSEALNGYRTCADWYGVPP